MENTPINTKVNFQPNPENILILNHLTGYDRMGNKHLTLYSPSKEIYVIYREFFYLKASSCWRRGDGDKALRGWPAGHNNQQHVDNSRHVQHGGGQAAHHQVHLSSPTANEGPVRIQ